MNSSLTDKQAKLAVLKESAESFGVPVDERAEIRRLAAENKVLRGIITEYRRKRWAEVDGDGEDR